MKKIAYVIVGVFVLSLIAMVPSAVRAPSDVVFKRGVGGSPETLDPAQAWDSASIDILQQVMEGLVAYNLTDPEMPIIPLLATDTGTWNADLTNVTFTLRSGITFHNGDPLNATAVKYTFDRLNHLIEIEESQIAELYEPLAQVYPAKPLVIKEVVVVSPLTVTFVLNYPYIAFTALLCFSGSFIVHYDMPFSNLTELDDALIGTGPYVLTSYETEETHFTRYAGYWRSLPEIKEMVWILYDDDVAKQQAFLAGDIHGIDGILADYLTEYQNSPLHTVEPKKAGTSIGYMGMNKNWIPLPIRKAISYAIDYNYILNTIFQGLMIRMVSPIPPGILYHDPSVVPPSLNLTHARQILIDAGLSKGVTTTTVDKAWSDLVAAGGTPVASYNYTWNIGNKARSDIGLLIASNLAKIGIRVDVIGLTWPAYLEHLLGQFDHNQLYMIGWMADYNDPSNYINPLLSNTSSSNGARVNDPWLQKAMMDALMMNNATERKAAYFEMQHYVVEELYCWALMYTPVSVFVHNKGLTNYPRNAQGVVYFYPCIWNGPWEVPAKPFIPGYSFLALVGAAAVTVGVLLYKRRR